jgi:hypothetical protein
LKGRVKTVVLTACGMGVFALFGLAFVDNPGGILYGVWRLPATVDYTVTKKIPASIEPLYIEINRSTDELRRIDLTSPQPLIVDSRGRADEGEGIEVELAPGKTLVWTTDAQFFRPFPGDYVEAIEVRNPTGAEAELTLAVTTAPLAGDEVLLAPLTALGPAVAGRRLHRPKPVGFRRPRRSPWRPASREMSQPPFMLAVAVGTFAILVFVVLPYSTFGEDIKMLKDTGLTVIMLAGIIVALLAASTSVAEEIEGRTALTVLSKPSAVANLCSANLRASCGRSPCCLCCCRSSSCAASPTSRCMTPGELAYSATDYSGYTSIADPTWQQCQEEMVQVIPGIVLAFMEAAVLTALSIAISTRLPLLPNLTICLTIYALGHLTPLIVNSQVGGFAPVAFVGMLLATVLPVLGEFQYFRGHRRRQRSADGISRLVAAVLRPLHDRRRTAGAGPL